MIVEPASVSPTGERAIVLRLYTRAASHTYTYVERGGTGLEIPCPYYQIDVKIEGVATIFKSYLEGPGPVKIGDRVRARFRTGADATHTCLDLCWEQVQAT